MSTAYSRVKKLAVYRRLSNGSELLLGQLAQNQTAVYFQYDDDYLAKSHSLSPFKLPFSNALNQAPTHPHHGLHGVFSDSLPDGWGLLLMDRIFRQQGIALQHITAMDRLAYIGDTGIGALSYRPTIDWKPTNKDSWIDLSALGKQAMQLFDGKADSVLAGLANAGGSGGARPKALIYLDAKKDDFIATSDGINLQPWLVKFTSQNLLLGHDEGLCEAAYLTMAKNAGISVPEWRLFNVSKTSNAKAWLGVKRFDCSTENKGRHHVHSLCGLLDADFRQPSMDYEDLIKVSQVLCNRPDVGKQQFTRAVFNLFACNQDDHSKNWSFIMDEDGQWQLAPFYDVTFSPNLYHQHMMSYGGYGQQPPLKTMQKLAAQANFSSWKAAQKEIEKVLQSLSKWPEIGKEFGITNTNIKMISKQLDVLYRESKLSGLC